jgi:hypothetical protein
MELHFTPQEDIIYMKQAEIRLNDLYLNCIL